jgi:hypothetical protein
MDDGPTPPWTRQIKRGLPNLLLLVLVGLTAGCSIGPSTVTLTEQIDFDIPMRAVRRASGLDLANRRLEVKEGPPRASDLEGYVDSAPYENLSPVTRDGPGMKLEILKPCPKRAIVCRSMVEIVGWIVLALAVSTSSIVVRRRPPSTCTVASPYEVMYPNRT